MYKALSNTFVRALFLLNNSVVKKQNVKVILGQAQTIRRNHRVTD